MTFYGPSLLIDRSFNLRDLSAKCSITLLKYPDLIPQDKAFYQAGIACREQGNINLSFLLLNRFKAKKNLFKSISNLIYTRYVDLTEAIDASDSSFLDNTEFQDADAIPLQDTLPKRHYLDNEALFLFTLMILLCDIVPFTGRQRGSAHVGTVGGNGQLRGAAPSSSRAVSQHSLRGSLQQRQAHLHRHRYLVP